MAALIIIVCIAAFIGGFISGNKKYNKMTPQQRREQEQKTMETFAGFSLLLYAEILGVDLVGSCAIAVNVEDDA